MSGTKSYEIYVGTYARATDGGIYHFTATPTGTECSLSLLDVTSGIENPSFIEIDGQHQTLYAVSEVGAGEVVAFRRKEDGGKLQRLVAQSTRGGSPCHVIRSSDSRFIICTNYMGGNACLYALDGEGVIAPAADEIRHKGSGPNPDRQEAPHPHSAMLDLAGQYVLFPDLGLDTIFVYRLHDNPLRLTLHDEVRLQPESGPRHFKFHPSGRFGYVVNELSSTVTAFAYDGLAGKLTEIQSLSSLPAEFTGQRWAADIHISDDGRFLYVSNRGHDSIAVFSIDAASGKLSPIQYESTRGQTPRNFALSPDGEYLFVANQDSDSIATFTVDQETGRITFTGQLTTVPKPTCVQFV